jgi:hypothetical protein
MLKNLYSRLNSKLREVATNATLAAGLGDFLHERLTAAQAEEKIKKDLGLRAENFLEVARTQIYARAGSPYLRLLRLAGCEFADLAAHVRHHGLESALEKLAKEGVYFTSEEFRGKKEVVRGKDSFRVSPADFLTTDPLRGIAIQTGGTRNTPIRSFLSTARLAEQRFELAVLFSAHCLSTYRHALYDGILPVSGGIKFLLVYARMGVPVDRWFARKIPANSPLGRWYHYATTYVIVLTGRWHGHRFPKLEFTDIQDIERIVEWVLESKRRGMACCIKTGASSACRIANVARKKGISLEGTKFLIGGEPFTEAKRDAIEQAGARAVPRYSFGEGGSVGLGCASPLHTDEVHVSRHRLALIRQPRPIAETAAPIHPLLFTTFAPHEVRLLLNVENGDYATFESRDCGCALEKLGLKLHIHHIRSFEKFTSEGMNYFYGDLFELFEKVLPAEFGGGPGDYQLVEEEDERGQTRLSLLVHPRVGSLDETRLVSHFRTALAQGPRSNRVTARLWQDARTFRVVRKAPHASVRGKILPLHIIGR